MAYELRRVRHAKTGVVGWACAAPDSGNAHFFDSLDESAWRAGRLTCDAGVVKCDALTREPAFWGTTVYGFAENYRGGAVEKAVPERPLLFIKPGSAVVPEHETVGVERLTSRGARIWGESELAVVVGEDRKPLGVTLANDVTMEMPGYLDQDHHLPYLKGQPGFCPCSSLLLPLSTLESYEVEGFHNGELLRSGTRGDQIFSWEELWAWLCAWTQPRPGELVLIGAPRRIRPRQYVEPGDVFTTVLNGVHRLETRFG